MLFIQEDKGNKISLFGGNKHLFERSSNNNRKSILYDLKIIWSDNPNRPVPLKGELVENPDSIVFQGRPSFAQNMPNKFYYK